MNAKQFIEEQQEKAVKKLTRDCNLAYPSGCTEFCSLREIVLDTINATARHIEYVGRSIAKELEKQNYYTGEELDQFSLEHIYSEITDIIKKCK